MNALAANQLAEPLHVDAPQTFTPVLLTRPLRPGTAAVSVFGDDRWDLTPAFFEDHAPGTSINFTQVPTPMRPAAKAFIWQVLNCEHPPQLRGIRTKRLAVRTVVGVFRATVVFLTWLDSRGITGLPDVTQADLDAYLSEIRAAELAHQTRVERVGAVRQLWTWRQHLHPDYQLPATPPWRGEDTGNLVGRRPRDIENRTPRIPAATMDRLLLWALRFVQDFANDILAIRDDYLELSQRSGKARQHPDIATAARRHNLPTDLDALLEHHRSQGLGLPGKTTPTGKRTPDLDHLGRLLNCPTIWLHRHSIGHQLESSGLPIADAAYLHAPILGQLDRRPWLDQPITYQEAGQLLQHLCTAAFIVIAYLSGARPGEILTLRRGCIRHDTETGLWLTRGRKWKGAVDDHGAKLAEGEDRTEPWVVVEPVATAVTVLERLHDRSLLFPTTLFDNQRSATLAKDRLGKAFTGEVITRHIDRFITWIASYCTATGRDEHVPPDPAGKQLWPSRFRRTLAWHIVRRPRGLIAGAIQYGHINVAVTLGYAGTYASGFPDEHAFESWLQRLDQLADAEHHLRDGEHVSGPAARSYTGRVHHAAQRFSGRVLTTTRQARDLLINPALQIHPAEGMTCVYDPDKALCRIGPTRDDIRRTPDLTDCHTSCQNIARTDRDIQHIRRQADELAKLVDDPLSPQPRRERERHELARLQVLLAEHETTRPKRAR